MVLQVMIFFTLFSLVYFGMHYYVYVHVANALVLSASPRLLLRVTFLLFALASVSGMMLGKHLSSWATVLVSSLGMVWMGVMAIALSAFVLYDMFFLVVRVPSWHAPAAIITLAIIGITSIYSLYNGTRLPVTNQVHILVHKPSFAGKTLRIVQLSDLHIDFSRSPHWLDAIVKRVNALNPDVVVLTGDIIDADLCSYDRFCGSLRALRAANGVYAVTGNHEFYAGIPAFLELARHSNITVLRNEHRIVADRVILAGIDDTMTIRRSGGKSDLANTLQGLDPSSLIILLSHQPDEFDAAQRQGVDVQLSGHTHAGQIPPFDVMVRFYFRYPFGLYTTATSALYTTCGTGTWGPPMRLFSRSEIVEIVLEGPQAS